MIYAMNTRPFPHTDGLMNGKFSSEVKPCAQNAELFLPSSIFNCRNFSSESQGCGLIFWTVFKFVSSSFKTILCIVSSYFFQMWTNVLTCNTADVAQTVKTPLVLFFALAKQVTLEMGCSAQVSLT